MKKNIFYFLPMMLLAGCTSGDLNEGREPVITGDQEIQLSTGVGNLPTHTRAVINSTLPTAGLDVSILRLDATGTPTATFPAWNTVTSAAVKSAHVDATNGQVAFKNGTTTTHEYYQANGNKTRLQGWYPKDGAVAAGKITWTIDGAKDIMVSNYQDADKTNKFGSGNKLQFEHMLTQMVVKAYATGKPAFDAWGGIKSVSVKEPNLTCEVTLADAAITSATFKGKTTNTHLPIIKKNMDDTALSPDYDPTKGLAYDYTNNKTNATLCGYAMFAPASAAGITLIIETATGGIIEKAIAQEFKAGFAYNVTLKLTSTEIVPVVAISEWKTTADSNVDVEL